MGTLQQNFTVLQSTNSSLAEKIKLLEGNQEETRHELELTASELRKEMEEKANIQKSFQELQAAKSKEVEESFSAIQLTTSALHTRLEEEESQNEAHGKRITALENNLAQIDDMKLTTRLTEIENNEVDVQMKLQNLESADVFLQEAHRMLMEKSSGVELELKQMDINFDQLRQSTENKIQMNLQTIANNNKQSQANAESIKSILMTQSSISDQLNELSSKHNESWSSVDSFLSKQSEMVNELNSLRATDIQNI